MFSLTTEKCNILDVSVASHLHYGINSIRTFKDGGWWRQTDETNIMSRLHFQYSLISGLKCRFRVQKEETTTSRSQMHVPNNSGTALTIHIKYANRPISTSNHSLGIIIAANQIKSSKKKKSISGGYHSESVTTELGQSGLSRVLKPCL